MAVITTANDLPYDDIDSIVQEYDGSIVSILTPGLYEIEVPDSSFAECKQRLRAEEDSKLGRIESRHA